MKTRSLPGGIEDKTVSLEDLIRERNVSFPPTATAAEVLMRTGIINMRLHQLETNPAVIYANSVVERELATTH